jgi:hypothetical protein
VLSLQRLMERLQHALQPGQILQRVHQRVERCCFPESALVSLAVPTRNSDTICVGVIDSDGMLLHRAGGDAVKVVSAQTKVAPQVGSGPHTAA